ncbi:MAG: HPr kinase/phosphatase C-terminal domain-containing protein [Rhizobiaceae bacterium]|nr:HPr kinase/phosphatase C-terminal domain-containing protein [Rhizobiaceae bacterium]
MRRDWRSCKRRCRGCAARASPSGSPPKADPLTENVHGTLVLLGDRGVLIIGPSGSGKSSLALDLIAHSGGFAVLVSDDRVLVERHADGRLVGRAPSVIAGQIEVRGIGIVARPFEPRALVDLVVDLTDPERVERMPEAQSWNGVPLLRVPWRACALARQHVAAALTQPKSGL